MAVFNYKVVDRDGKNKKVPSRPQTGMALRRSSSRKGIPS